MSLRQEILKEIKAILKEEASAEQKGVAVSAGVGSAGLGAGLGALASGGTASGFAAVPAAALGAGAFLAVAAPATMVVITKKLTQNLQQFAADKVAANVINEIKTNFTTSYGIGAALARIVSTNPGANIADILGKEINNIMANIAAGDAKQCLAFVAGWYSVTSPNDANKMKQIGRLPASFDECKQVGFTNCRERQSFGSTEGFGRGGILIPRNNLQKLDWFGDREEAKNQMSIIWNKASKIKDQDTPTPKPPKPEPKPEIAKSGLCKPPYVGKNGGVSQGPAVQQVQEILANPKIGLLKNAQFTPGQVDTATNNAIFSLQEKLAPLGSKIASGLGGTYDGQAIKPDGCYGPKTSCAVSLYYGLPDVYNKGKNKCMAILGIKAKALAKASGEVGFPASKGMVDLEESKNWADRTRESASTSLFERLVKDVSNKKVI